MAEMYEVIDRLLDERGISGAQMAAELGMSRSFMTELRKGRAKSIKIETAQKLADYFNVSLDYLTGKETEKAPAETSRRSVSDDDIKFALWGDCEDISDADLADVKRYAAFVRERKKDQQ